jgi:hypothetical protein
MQKVNNKFGKYVSSLQRTSLLSEMIFLKSYFAEFIWNMSLSWELKPKHTDKNKKLKAISNYLKKYC